MRSSSSWRENFEQSQITKREMRLVYIKKPLSDARNGGRPTEAKNKAVFTVDELCK